MYPHFSVEVENSRPFCRSTQSISHAELLVLTLKDEAVWTCENIALRCFIIRMHLQKQPQSLLSTFTILNSKSKHCFSFNDMCKGVTWIKKKNTARKQTYTQTNNEKTLGWNSVFWYSSEIFLSLFYFTCEKPTPFILSYLQCTLIKPSCPFYFIGFFL